MVNDSCKILTLESDFVWYVWYHLVGDIDIHSTCDFRFEMSPVDTDVHHHMIWYKSNDKSEIWVNSSFLCFLRWINILTYIYIYLYYILYYKPWSFSGHLIEVTLSNDTSIFKPSIIIHILIPKVLQPAPTLKSQTSIIYPPHPNAGRFWTFERPR